MRSQLNKLSVDKNLDMVDTGHQVSLNESLLKLLWRVKRWKGAFMSTQFKCLLREKES